MLNYNTMRSTEDYWNESRNSYEVRFANHSYEIKVETTGFKPENSSRVILAAMT